MIEFSKSQKFGNRPFCLFGFIFAVIKYGCGTILANRWVIFTVFFLITSVFTPCIFEVFDFVGGDVLFKLKHGFGMHGVIAFNDSKDINRFPVLQSQVGINVNQSFEKSALKLKGSGVSLFPDGCAYGASIPEHASQSGDRQRKYSVDNTVGHDFISPNGKNKLAETVGLVLGYFLCRWIIRRFYSR